MHLKRERYLLGGTAKFFRQKVKSRRVKKARLRAERQKQFRKGFVKKSSVPKSFDVRPELPTRGKSRFGTIKKRVRRFF